MVAGLFSVAQYTPQQGAKTNQEEPCPKGKTLLHPQRMQYRKSAQYSNGSGTKLPQQSQKYSQAHIPGQRFHQANQAGHHLNP